MCDCGKFAYFVRVDCEDEATLVHAESPKRAIEEYMCMTESEISPGTEIFVTPLGDAMTFKCGLSFERIDD